MKALIAGASRVGNSYTSLDQPEALTYCHNRGIPDCLLDVTASSEVVRRLSLQRLWERPSRQDIEILNLSIVTIFG
jgi:hypothetical protein